LHALRIGQGRRREMVADHQGAWDQSAIIRGVRSGSCEVAHRGCGPPPPRRCCGSPRRLFNRARHLLHHPPRHHRRRRHTHP
jgi:hypothetical protein